jgi:tetratricopeptide (TPR) repeat protein
MGLVDDETGLLYYINAEHPWTVLYRDGKASFLEEELALRKLGTPGQEDKFYVRLFPLMAGDVVITGSDGRDDLLIQTPTGEEVVQEDETQFLRRVEEGNGKIPEILERLKASGKIMDDISLLRVSYKEDIQEEKMTALVSPEIVQKVEESKLLLESGKIKEAYEKIKTSLDENQKFPEMLKLLGKLYFNMGDYSRAIECFEEYVNLNPSDNEYLYALSNTYRLFGKFNQAADIGERLYLRDQKNVLNLLNLASIYLELKVIGRANYMIEKTLQIEPENEQAKNLKEIIYEKRDKLAFKQEEIAEDKVEETYKQAENYYKEQHYAEAIELYEAIVSLDKYQYSAKLLLKIANCYSHMNELNKAIIYYNRAISLDDFNFHAHNNLGGVYFRQGLYEKAKYEWLKALEIKSDFKPAKLNLQRLEKYALKKTV